jgi:hypothetical protein
VSDCRWLIMREVLAWLDRSSAENSPPLRFTTVRPEVDRIKEMRHYHVKPAGAK